MGLLEPRKTTGNLNSTDLTRKIKFHCLCGCSYLQKPLKTHFSISSEAAHPHNIFN